MTKHVGNMHMLSRHILSSPLGNTLLNIGMQQWRDGTLSPYNLKKNAQS
jgi:hypothetical protein